MVQQCLICISYCKKVPPIVSLFCLWLSFKSVLSYLRVQNPGLQTTLMTCYFLWLSCHEPFGFAQRHTSCWGQTAKYDQPVHLKINPKKEVNKACRDESELFFLSIQTLDFFIHSLLRTAETDIQEHQLKEYYWFALAVIILCHEPAATFVCHHMIEGRKALIRLLPLSKQTSIVFVAEVSFSVQTELLLFTVSPPPKYIHFLVKKLSFIVASSANMNRNVSLPRVWNESRFHSPKKGQWNKPCDPWMHECLWS